MTPTHLCWLHVSDFHFEAGADPFSQTVAAEALIRDVAARRPARGDPAFVVVTGDVAFSGRTDEYEAARPFLAELAVAAGVEPASFYFVPGNHDVDRTVQRLAFAGACTELATEADVDRVLGGEEVAPLRDRQAAFWQFVDGFTTGQIRTPTVQGLGYVTVLTVAGIRLVVVGLNTAWLSGRNGEEMQLLLGERQVIEAMAIVAESDPMLVLALAHHPIEWMHEWDQGACRERLLAASDLLHRGHLHQPDLTLSGGPASPCLTVAAGSSHSTRFYGNSYNWVELDIGAGRCTVQPHRYDPSLGRYEPGQPVSASIELRGSIPGTTHELADAISGGVPEAEPYAGYLASLLRGEKQDVPVARDGGIDFLVPSVAREVAGEQAFRVADAFLGLRNKIRLYATDVPLIDRVLAYRESISAMAGYIGLLAGSDPAVARRVESPPGPTQQSGPTAGMPHTFAFLEQLRTEGAWGLLEAQVIPVLTSPVPEVAHAAKRLHVEALMHSDEAPKRQLAKSMGAELIDPSGADVEDFLLAAAASEAAGDHEQAIGLAKDALEQWPDDEILLEYSRGLATRAGRRDLREFIERSAGVGP